MKILNIINLLLWVYWLPNFASGSTSQLQPLCVVNPVDLNDSLSIHAKANPVSQTIGMLPNNGYFIHKLGEISANNSTWYQVSYQNLTGWVKAQYLLCFLSPEAAKQAIGKRTEQVIQALKKSDFIQLATYVHPNKGVRFSPYAYIELETDLVLTTSQLKKVVNDNNKQIWGVHEGSGEPISLSFSDYYKKFIYNNDFSNATQVVYNTNIINSNTRNNMREVYPDAIIVEYHFPGFEPHLEGDDWSSLRLVFESFEKEWYLVGVIHAQWSV